MYFYIAKKTMIYRYK